MNLRYSGVLAMLCAMVFPSVSSAQTVIDFLGSQDSHWSGGNTTDQLVLNPISPGSIDLSDSDLGGIVTYNQSTAPPQNGSLMYGVNGFFNLREDTRFNHSVISKFSRLGSFGISILNHEDPRIGERSIDEIILLSNGGVRTISSDTFILPNATSDSAYISYNFTFRQGASPTQWIASGTFTNQLGFSILDYNDTFDMNPAFEGGDYFMGVSRLGGVPIVRGLELSNINSLNWTVTPIPEPSSMLLLSLGALGVFLRRKR